MTIDPNNPKHLIADEGMCLRRISNKIAFGKEVFLGIYNGKQEVPEDFEEVEDKEEDKPFEPNEEL